MSNLFKPWITRYVDSKTGKRVKKGAPRAKKLKTRAKKWYVKIKDVDGKWKAVPLSPRKDAAAIMSGEAHGKAAMAGLGVIDRYAQHRLTPMTAHLEAWTTSLAANDSTPKHVAMKGSMVQKIIDYCGFRFIADWSATEIEACLADFRKQPRFGIQTSNNYLGAAKQFSRWLYRNKRMADDPLLPLKPGNVALDRRHDRRELKDEELRRLLQATASGPVRCRLSGPDREMLYVTAIYTGLRASELASLEPESFKMGTNPPTVIVTAGFSKRRRTDTLPIHPGLQVRIAEWIIDKPSGVKLWPGRWAAGHDGGKMLKLDLVAARKAWILEAPEGPAREEREDSDFLSHKNAAGLFCDFHALRHSFISRLVRSGVAPKLAQWLSRHSTIRLTMDRYAHLDIDEAVVGLARMADIPLANDDGCQMVAKQKVHGRVQGRLIKRTEAIVTTKPMQRVNREKKRIISQADVMSTIERTSHRRESNPLPSALQADPSP